MEKVQSYVILIVSNVTMKPSNVIIKKKNKETIECGKNRVICKVGIAYCDNRTIKCEKKKKKRTIDRYNFIPKKIILLN